MSEEHTHTPLRIGYLGRHILDNNGVTIARCYGKEEAAHIVKCVNMHDELVANLKYIYKQWPDTSAGKHARATLRKAGAL